MARASNPRTPDAIHVRQRSIETTRILVSAIALALGLAGFAAGRAQAVAPVNEAVAAPIHNARVSEATASRPSVTDQASAGSLESNLRDESDPWAMLAAGLVGAVLIARRRTR